MKHIFFVGLVMPYLIFANPKAIIFDCDGTLVDSEGAHLSAWESVVKSYGKDLSKEERFLFIGKPDFDIAKLIEKKIANCTANKFLQQKEGFFKKYLQLGLPPIEGTVNFVRKLICEKERLNIKLAIASAASKFDILSNLKSLGLENAFDVIISGHDDLSDYDDLEGVNKPKPYIYLHVAKLLGVSPFDCVVIEDSSTGVIASKKAGCITIVVPNDYTQKQDLSKADLKIKSLSNVNIDDFLQMIQDIHPEKVK